MTAAAVPSFSSSNSVTFDYPMDSSEYTEFKKSLYALSQATANLCMKGQGAYDYYYWSVTPDGLVCIQDEYNEKMSKFESAIDYMNQMYQNYLNALANFKASMNCPTISMDDDIVVGQECM